MKRILLSIALFLGLVAGAQAQCVGVGTVNNAPYPGVSCAMDPTISTYAATGIGIVPAASATDIACITGSATKVVRVQAIRISGTAGTLVTLPVVITKHASANSGGTPATSTALPVPYAHDSTNVAATATTTAWTANPTINDATPGIIGSATISLNTTAALVGQGEVMFNWINHNFMQAPILRGVAQQLCINLNAVSVTSGLVNATFYWTEANQ